jgi:hypothetical protein
MESLTSNYGIAKRGLLLAGLTLAVSAQADLPLEREVTTVRSVQVYGAEARPIGAIDFSASGSAARRVGPWDVETDAFSNSDGVIFYDDGSARGNGASRQYSRPDGSRCETLGNVTVCR